MEYHNFLEQKSQLDSGDGFEPNFMPEFLFDFQKHLATWAVKTGRAAMFADCGMGKTPMQLVWAENVVRKTNKPVLIMAPLAVSLQTVEEATKFDIDAERCMDGNHNGAKIFVTNYEKLHMYNPDDFGGVVCDESSIMKNFDGSRKTEITAFMRKTRYRLLCTATASPNDYIELGTSSEALGYLGYMDMLSTFFKNDEDSLHPMFVGSKWRFKHHAEDRFWRWMASWARATRKPSDLGFDDGRFILPELIVNEHFIKSEPLPVDLGATGEMFVKPAKGLTDERRDTRATINERCEMAADLHTHDSSIAWCHLNDESKILNKLIPNSAQVAGPDSDEKKIETFQAFRNGEIKTLITKPKIAGFGMNWQHCNYMTYFPTHSFEQYYQSVRRCWRFGQEKPVTVDMVSSSAQDRVIRNLKSKSVACDIMFDKLIEHMNNALNINRMTSFDEKMEVPTWL